MNLPLYVYALWVVSLLALARCIYLIWLNLPRWRTQFGPEEEMTVFHGIGFKTFRLERHVTVSYNDKCKVSSYMLKAGQFRFGFVRYHNF